MTLDIADLRREYTRAGLGRDDLNADPVVQFERWFQDACDAGVREPNAMSLATVDGVGSPGLRTVLLKYFDSTGFVFFTNLESSKARQISQNQQVTLLFPWLDLERQVTISGRAETVSRAETLRYFSRRPHESQIGAWISRQSSVITSRKLLRMKFEEMRRKWRDGEVPLPDFWGGYRVWPQRVEFWQGRPNRLHDRFLYRRREDSIWQIDRLAP
jgi:pyridoxamine 5'-phosphate oxidase